MTPDTLPVSRMLRRIQASRESLTPPTVLDRYSRCISIGPRNRTRRGQKVGMEMPREFCCSCVFDFTSKTSEYTKENVDRSVRRCRCRIARGDCPGHSAKPTGHNSLLYRKYLSATERNSDSYLAQSRSIIHGAHLVGLGQRALVHEPGHESYWRGIGDIATAMGTSVSKVGLPTVQSPQAGTCSCVLCERGREVPHSEGGRTVASATTYLPVPLLRRPRCVFVQCQSLHLQGRHRLDRPMRHPILIPHDLADSSKEQPLFRAAFRVGLFLSHRHTIHLLPSHRKVPRTI
jgi:hypothetical protein